MDNDLPSTEPDLADTVIGVPDRPMPSAADLDEDTIVPGSGATPFQLVEPPEPQSSAPIDRVIATEWEETPAPGPRVYSIRIATHTPIPLNIPALIGRRPSAPRISRGEHTNLIRVPSPTREISSTHLELRQEGSTVVATDLDSTNGTIVTMPGFPPRKLRQGESAVISTGTVIELGDGMTIEVLAPSDGVS